MKGDRYSSIEWYGVQWKEIIHLLVRMTKIETVTFERELWQEICVRLTFTLYYRQVKTDGGCIYFSGFKNIRSSKPTSFGDGYVIQYHSTSCSLHISRQSYVYVLRPVSGKSRWLSLRHDVTNNKNISRPMVVVTTSFTW